MLACLRAKPAVVLAAALLGLTITLPREASAHNQSAPQLQVCVTASGGRGPVAGAVVTFSVFAERSTARKSETDTRGCTTFSSVPLGYLSVTVTKNGFDTAKQNVHISFGMEGALVNVALTPLAVIASVRSSASVRYKYYGPESRFAPLFRDLIEQMNALGGANIRVSPSGGVADVSLEGADPSLTSTTFDGVQVQSASAFDTIDVDALTKASTDLSDGSLSLYSLSPTPVLQRDWRMNYGGTSNLRPDLQESGTSGNLGYALQFAGNTLRSPLDGQVFSDSSGFTYKHTGRFLGGMTGGAFDMPIGPDVSVGAKYLRRISRTQPLEVIDSGAEPEGYGPYPVGTTDDGSILETRIDAQVGGWETRLQYENFASIGTTDLTRAYAGSVPAPSSGFSASDEGDTVLFAERPTVHNQTLNLNLTFSHSADRVLNRFETTTNDLTIVSSRRSLNADYNGFFGKHSFYEFSGNLDRDDASGQSAGRLKSYVRLQTGKDTTVFAALAGGSQLGLVPNAGVFALPSEVQYDCQSQTAIATAPNDKPSVPTGLEMRVGVTKSSGRSSFSIQAYERRYQGVTLTSALVPAAVEPPGFVPVNVIGSILSGFTTFGGCQPPANPIVYFEQNVAPAGVNYRGVEVTVGGHVGRFATYQFSLADNQSTLVSGDARLNGALSTYISGAQVPGVPPLTGSASVEIPIGSQARALLNDTFSSSNNMYHLPAFGLLTTGVVVRLDSVTSITIVATNVSHQFAGAFVSQKYAVPISTIGGRPFVPLATPLSIPALYFGVHFKEIALPAL